MKIERRNAISLSALTRLTLLARFAQFAHFSLVSVLKCEKSGPRVLSAPVLSVLVIFRQFARDGVFCHLRQFMTYCDIRVPRPTLGGGRRGRQEERGKGEASGDVHNKGLCVERAPQRAADAHPDIDLSRR